MNKHELLKDIAKHGDARHNTWLFNHIFSKWNVDKTGFTKREVDEFREDMLAVAAVAYAVIAHKHGADTVDMIEAQIELFRAEWDGVHQYGPTDWVTVLNSYLIDVHGVGQAFRSRMVFVAAKASEAVLSIDEQRLKTFKTFYEV